MLRLEIQRSGGFPEAVKGSRTTKPLPADHQAVPAEVTWFGLLRKDFVGLIATICAAPLILVAVMCIASWFVCATITFGIPPYYYEFQTARGTLTAQRSFCCVAMRGPRISWGKAQAFERAFYESWHRVYAREENIGVFTCRISYALSSETEALDSRLVVTPSSLVAIPHWLLLAAAALPLLPFVGFWFWVLQRKTSSRTPRASRRAALSGAEAQLTTTPGVPRF